jgi:hypothetical protein
MEMISSCPRMSCRWLKGGLFVSCCYVRLGFGLCPFHLIFIYYLYKFMSVRIEMLKVEYFNLLYTDVPVSFHVLLLLCRCRL